jgi:lauroyl/myristoyl acyltransferase
MFVVSAATRLVFSLTSALAWAGFYLLRLGERVLPRMVMSLLLWPPAAAWDLVQLGQRKPVTSWRRFPEAWHPKPARFFLRQSLGLCHARLIYIWPDRLRSPRWLSRCRLEGGRDLIGSRNEDRGVVLAHLHFGPSEILPYWLRAHGIVTTALVGRPKPLQRLASRQHALSAPADVPLFLPVNEMLRHVRIARNTAFTYKGKQLMGPGRRVLVAVDVNRGQQVYVPFENHLFRMATGAIRLAALAKAELIPCLIVETASWNFAIHFGTPVPGCYLGNRPNLKAAAAHLLKEFLKVVTCYPTQCSHTLLSCISPAAVEEDQSSYSKSPESERTGRTQQVCAANGRQ